MISQVTESSAGRIDLLIALTVKTSKLANCKILILNLVSKVLYLSRETQIYNLLINKDKKRRRLFVYIPSSIFSWGQWRGQFSLGLKALGAHALSQAGKFF
jgi:hypothetical protein